VDAAVIPPKVHDPRFEFLYGTQRNAFSQNGEDGILAALFDRFGETNRWCFEAGASDGIWLSNTKLLRDAGWSAVLIECDEKHLDALNDQAVPGRVWCVNAKVHPASKHACSLDSILAAVGAPEDMDLGVIDVDGPDCDVWEGLTQFRPRVMVVEYKMDYGPSDLDQKPLGDVIRLGRKKRYDPACVIGCNAILVRDDLTEVL
jgi:hypothetical protein